jgi:hypothetical protein
MFADEVFASSDAPFLALTGDGVLVVGRLLADWDNIERLALSLMSLKASSSCSMASAKICRASVYLIVVLLLKY